MKDSWQQALVVISLICGLLLVAGCSSNPPSDNQSSRYKQKHDTAPGSYRDVSNVPDAVPKVEPLSRGGNKSPYQVFGNQYQVMPSSFGYKATGTASWYGTKFHGYHTSNGEIYDMYTMTAAHKSLPIPTYLRVTNLNNNRQVIVRVNDRGPFHGDRLIDLSYAAATRLGYASQGTAPVRIEAIDPVAWQRDKSVTARLTTPASLAKPITEINPPASATVTTSAAPELAAAMAGKIVVQVGAFTSFDSANRLKQQLQSLVGEEVVVILDRQHAPNLHKVHVGPVKDLAAAQQVRDLISRNGFGSSLILALPQL